MVLLRRPSYVGRNGKLISHQQWPAAASSSASSASSIKRSARHLIMLDCRVAPPFVTRQTQHIHRQQTKKTNKNKNITRHHSTINVDMTPPWKPLPPRAIRISFLFPPFWTCSFFVFTELGRFRHGLHLASRSISGSPRFGTNSTEFYRVLPSFAYFSGSRGLWTSVTEFYRVLPSLNEFLPSLADFGTFFYLVLHQLGGLLDFRTGFYRVFPSWTPTLPNCIILAWLLPSFEYRVFFLEGLLDFEGILPSFTEFSKTPARIWPSFAYFTGSRRFWRSFTEFYRVFFSRTIPFFGGAPLALDGEAKLVPLPRLGQFPRIN